MAIAIPQPGNDVDATLFGAPVANAVNSLGAMKLDAIGADVTAPGGSKTSIYSKAITVPSSVIGLFAIIVVGFNANGVGDLLDPANKVLASVPQMNGGSLTTVNYVAKVGSTVTVGVIMSPWGGQSIMVMGNKSYVALMPVLTLVTGNTFP